MVTVAVVGIGVVLNVILVIVFLNVTVDKGILRGRLLTMPLLSLFGVVVVVVVVVVAASAAAAVVVRVVLVVLVVVIVVVAAAAVVVVVVFLVVFATAVIIDNNCRDWYCCHCWHR